jgi:general transcription factor 3C polypeptide 3 (transcription factor C subunit 4)
LATPSLLRYLAGQLSFKALMQEMKEEEEEPDEEDREEESDDEEWRPPGAARKARPGTPERRKRSMESFESELEDTQKAQLKRRKKPGGTTRRRRLEPALQGLMGEANLRFARGDGDTAERMCMEVIRQDPTAPEPFQTLATLYEEQGELERSLQFGLLAAHLAPQDGEEWARLADMSLEQGDAAQAADCYRKAIEADPSVARYHFTRAGLLEQRGDRKGAVRCYRRLLVELGEGQGEDFLQATRLLAKLLHQRENLQEASKCFAEAFDKFGDCVNNEDVNLYLELLIGLEAFPQALEVCCQWGGVQFSGPPQEEVAGLDSDHQLASFTELVKPDEMPADIQAKLLVVLVHLKAVHLIAEITETFLEADIESFGDLVLDIAEAMMKTEQWEAALPFLLRLTSSAQWGEAAVWNMLAECQAATHRLEEAERSYAQVVRLAPHVYQARLQLSLIMRRLGRAEDALDTLRQDEQAELLNPHLMFERCQMLLAENKLEEFISKSKLLFFRHFINIRNKDELHAVSSAKKMSTKNKALHEVRSFRREPLTELAGPEFEAENQVAKYYSTNTNIMDR